MYLKSFPFLLVKTTIFFYSITNLQHFYVHTANVDVCVAKVDVYNANVDVYAAQVGSDDFIHQTPS